LKGEDMKPIIVCLCGSTRFKDAFDEANYRQTMKGKIVLSVGFFMHTSGNRHGGSIGCTPAEKIALDELHKRKIDLADEILVLNVNGYIGESTRFEIEYAHIHKKIIRFLDIEKAPKLKYSCGCNCNPEYGHSPSCMEDNWSPSTYYCFESIPDTSPTSNTVGKDH
jgi:hypothetical protein